jgi:hypothetical protein
MPRNRKPKPIQNAEPKPATSAEVSKILYSPGFDKLDPELQTAILRKLILDDSTQASNTPPTEDFAAYKDRTLFNSKLLAFWLVMGLFLLFAIAFVSIFVYVTLKQGVLNNTDVITGLFSTIAEVLKIIFGVT